jgi:hypothetical protein
VRDARETLLMLAFLRPAQRHDSAGVATYR